ncbi:MAG: choice-of-anchor J domain-containing protein [Ignavibacteria bacterium]
MKKYLIIILFLSSFRVSLSQGILWEEGFESLNIFSNGWTLINNDSSASLPEIYSSFTFAKSVSMDPQEGNHFFKFSFDDVNYKNYADDWLITSKLIGILAGDSISFWCGAVDENYKDSLKIWVSTTDTLLSSFTLIDHFKVDGPAGTWHKKSYDLSQFSGKNIFFAVNYHLTNGGPLGSSSDNVWIDNFTLTGNDPGKSIPETFMLRQNFPNPFNPQTEIVFSVPERTGVTIKIYDALGKELVVLAEGIYERGNYNLTFAGNNFPSGVYFYKMISGNFQDTKKMELIK